MRRAIEALNKIRDDGVIGDYAIGGAVAARQYLPTLQTEDLDVFMFLESSGLLVDLGPVYGALMAQGAVPKGEYIILDNVPVQLLSDGKNSLLTEAIRTATLSDLKDDHGNSTGVVTRIFTAEHLCAVALQTGRPKDFLRVEQFVQENQVDLEKLKEITDRHGLREPWDSVQALAKVSRALNRGG